MNTQDLQTVETAFRRLLDSYTRSNHRQKTAIIEKAYRFALAAHEGSTRQTGEPYILHPISVATICSEEMGLGSTTICVALLHEIIEHTDHSLEELRQEFGERIAGILENLSKISGGILGNQSASVQTEKFRRLLLTMSDDIRVILVKMADRLDNMRSFEALKPERRMLVANEALWLYAPLADRLGLYRLKTEMENLAFVYKYPEEYAVIAAKLDNTAPLRDEIYKEFTTPLFKELDTLGIGYQLKSRIKSAYSIYRKMHDKGVSLEEVYDILAVRIIFEPPADLTAEAARVWETRLCWAVFGVVCSLYRPHPDRIRDWITSPKANGYEALHLTVMGPKGHWIEVQIRSRRMDAIAEGGFAAHWKYKAGGEASTETELNDWLGTIKELLENPGPAAMDTLENIKMNLFSSEIFVFTRTGEIKTIAQGATVLDFAYALHSEIGDHCSGARVNHHMVGPEHRLKSGDQVEILTAPDIRPNEIWLTYVSTARARSRIHAFLRHRNTPLDS